jgi:hypothetical protein
VAANKVCKLLVKNAVSLAKTQHHQVVAGLVNRAVAEHPPVDSCLSVIARLHCGSWPTATIDFGSFAGPFSTAAREHLMIFGTDKTAGSSDVAKNGLYSRG